MMNSELIKKIKLVLNNPQFSEKDKIEQVDKLIANLEYDLNQVNSSVQLHELFDPLMEVIEDKTLQQRIIYTGYEGLDKELGGFLPGEYIVFGGRPAMGKTQLMINLAMNISKDHPLLYYSFDLPIKTLFARFLAAMSGIAANKIITNKLSKKEKSAINFLKKELDNYNIYINESGSNSFPLIKAQIKQHVEEHNVKLVIIDYLQLLSSKDFNYNRDKEISYINRELKALAKEKSICIIIVSQLNRSVEVRGGIKTPLLADLRDSGSIEQDADKVILLYRPEYYGVMEDFDGNSNEGLLDLIIAKNKSAGLGTAKLMYDKNFASFYDYENTQNELRIDPGMDDIF